MFHERHLNVLVKFISAWYSMYDLRYAAVECARIL